MCCWRHTGRPASLRPGGAAARIACRDETRRAAEGDRSRVLFFLARDTDAGPRNRVQTRLRNWLAAIPADPVGALVDAPERLLDRLQDLRVGLLQLELDVHLGVATGLIR